LAQEAPEARAARWLATPRLLAFAGGAVVPQGLADLPSPAWLGVGLLLALLARRWSWLPFAFALGLGWSVWHATGLLNTALPAKLEGRDVTVAGVIATLPQRRGRATRFELVVDHGQPEAVAGVPHRLRLAWYGTHPPLAAGVRWRLRLRLKRPHGFHNPGGFDFEGWLFRRGIRATGYVRDHPDNERLGDAAGPGHALQRLRQRLYDALVQALDGTAHGGLLIALALGERGKIATAQWMVLRSTGTSHLVAISGLHLGLVTGLVFALARRGWAWSGLARYVPAPHAAAWLSLPAAALYAGLAGFTVPTQRALVMVAVVMVALLLRRALAPGRALVLALAGVLLIDPLAPGSPGFWLSFVAVALILYTVAWRRAAGWRLLRVAWLQVVLAIGLAPLLVLAFNQVPLVSPLANLFAVPLVGLLLVPLVLVATLLLLPWPEAGRLLLLLAERLLAATWPWLQAGAELPLAMHVFSTPPIALLLLAAFGLALLLAPRGVALRLPGVVLLLPLFTFRPETPPHGAAWLTLLDVGQGLAAIVRTRQKVLVFDTGPAYSANFDAGGAILVPVLRRLGLERIDTLVVSHGDSDHAGGLGSLRAGLPSTALYVGAGVPGAGGADPCRAGQGWRWDGVDFSFLHPGDGEVAGNDGSCVLRVTAGGGSLLLTGDIERDAEARLLAGAPGALEVDVLQVPHHGSRTSSTPPFVAATRPGIALVASGWRNRFGLPDPGVVARYAEVGSTVINTATAGAVQVRLPARPGTIEVHRHRDRARRFWHAR
jgi:competence protein ComEC